MSATVPAVEDMIVFFGRHYGAEFYDETRMTYLLSKVHSLSTIIDRSARLFTGHEVRHHSLVYTNQNLMLTENESETNIPTHRHMSRTPTLRHMQKNSNSVLCIL